MLLLSFYCCFKTNAKPISFPILRQFEHAAMQLYNAEVNRQKEILLITNAEIIPK